MKGRSKLVFVMFAILALVATGVCFAFAKKSDKVNHVAAKEIAGYTADYDGVIFSVERVYFATGSDASKPLNVGAYKFQQIEASAGTRYFGDIALASNDGNFNHKDVVYDGDFVMVDDTVGVTATTTTATGDQDVKVKQGIMVTLGGYYKTDSSITTNATTKDKDDKDVENGATITYIGASATLNGVAQDLPSARSFSNGMYEDFTWFIEAPQDGSTEGHYEMVFEYMIDGQVSTFDFDFYLLLKSKYTNNANVNGKDYPRAPKIENAPEGKYHLGGDNFPTLTFDYSRYDLQIVHSSGDVTETIEFDYDEVSRNISLTSQIHDDIEVEYYKVPTEFSANEKILTLMFVDNGKYTFKFNYIYDYFGQKIAIPTTQESISDLTLDIYGYQLKYSKAGVNSADMEYLEVYRNNTMFILLNGFTDASGQNSSANLGVNYKIVDDGNYKTGEIDNDNRENAIISEGDFSNPTKVKYQKTDRGIWLALNDEYDVDNSFYYHSTSKFTGNLNPDKYSATNPNGKREFTKVTTFTTPGYYLVQVAYKYGTDDSIGYQYFAFEITSATPILNLYTTKVEKIDDIAEDESNREDFYAYEFTNQNVYADWITPERFQSTIEGKLYYSTSRKYETESALRAVADGAISASVVKKEYNRETFIKDSGAYLLVLEVGGTATKTYTYFTIDKDDISGLTVHEVNPIYVGSKIGYMLTKNANLNYVTHTEKAVIDVMFALDWNAKESGAKISATYRYTPFVKNNTTTSGAMIKAGSASSYYNYIINEYKLGSTTNPIKFEWVNKGINVNADNVMIEQGIYEFALEDQAGNKLNYVMILDQTEAVVLATYGDANAKGEKAKYVSGQMVADYVEMDWGTHKAIDLAGYGSNTTDDSDTTVELLLGWVNGYGQSTADLFEHYNKENGNNLNALTSMFKPDVDGKNLLVVENRYSKIQIASNDYKDSWFKLKSATPSSDANKPESDYKAFVKAGMESIGWNRDDARDDAKVFATTLQGGTYKDIAGTNEFTYTGTESDLKISVNPDYLRRYIIGVKGANNVGSTEGTQFAVYITPDKTLGQVYSDAADGGSYETAVQPNGQNTALNETANDKYYDGQASDDGVFVFEWSNPTEKDSFKVVDIQYDYYQLMDQGALSAVNKDTAVNDLDNLETYYYPYKYVRSEHILEIDDNGVQKVKNYTEDVTRNSYGQSSKVNRSNSINLGYETFYEDNDLVTRSVTQTGLYIITRTIKMTEGESKGDEASFSYAFFVDRNMIIGYDVNDIKQKLVGQFIHVAMPNSEGAEGVKYDNFTKQGVKSVTVQDSNETIETSVYLQTNKLPTHLKVPTGKYVSGDVESREIYHTSNVNMELRLSVYFKDTYGILQGEDYNGADIQIITDAEVRNSEDGYIPFTLDNTAQAAIYNKARKHTDEVLTVPGTYVFVIMDRVGKAVNDVFEVTDYNKEAFAIELLNHGPKTDVYAYANIDNETSDKEYSEDLQLYTNQQYVEFVIPREDTGAYMAQLDIGSVVVYRNDLGSQPWLKFTYENNQLNFDKNGVIKDNQNDAYYKEDENGWVIKLDTGLTVVDDVIVDYKEYVYTISISYILKNSKEGYYTYVDKDGKEQSFYNTVYTVNIDRTPSDNNLKEIIKGQEEYFTGYHTWLAEENDTEFDSKINDTFAYRDGISVRDYYALTNKLYYEYADKNGNLSNQAMYAITIDDETEFNSDGLKGVYYRRLDLDGGDARNRMGLLPIIKEYSMSNDYFVFSEAVGEYTMYPTGDADTYIKLLGGKDYDYADYSGGLYEFVEIDLAGNYTQYVVYFDLEDTQNVEVVVNAQELKENQTDVMDVTVELKKDKPTTTSFINYGYVLSVNNVAATTDVQDTYYPYYGLINVYRGTELVESIYLNTTTINKGYDTNSSNYTDNDISSRINEVLKHEGNYDIKFVDVYGQSAIATVNVYQSDKHSLNTSALVRKKSPDGKYYVEFSGLNTPVGNAWWYVTKVEVTHSGLAKPVEFEASQLNGVTTLTLDGDNPDDSGVVLSQIEGDRLYLTKENTSYIITVTDVAGKRTSVPISTKEEYIPYELDAVGNSYSKENIVYTANDVTIKYDATVYKAIVGCYDIDGNEPDNNESWYEGDAGKLTLLADNKVDATHLGSYRKMVVEIRLNNAAVEDPAVVRYQVVIDTRVLGSFEINNLDLTSCLNTVESKLNNGGIGADNNWIEDYSIDELLKPEYYNKLINETVNVRWTPQSDNSYFRYTYQLFEFVNSEKHEELLYNPQDPTYQISPKDNTTGKYIFKVTVTAENGVWIASRIYGISMSTTISGLYEVTYTDGTPREYSAITTLSEIAESLIRSDATIKDFANHTTADGTSLATVLGFDNAESLLKALLSFGERTAIPLYIANEPLSLNSNKDNGVDAKEFVKELNNGNTIVKFYRVWRSNYQTFAAIMEVKASKNSMGGSSLLKKFTFSTSDFEEGTYDLLKAASSKTIYDEFARFYELSFNSYYANSDNPTPLEMHNKIKISILYAGQEVNTVFGEDSFDGITSKEFNNSGSYKLKVSDIAGNKQTFKNATSYTDTFNLVVMRANEILYTMTTNPETGGKAPIKYPYYDKPVTLQIDRQNNYDINSINVQVYLNSRLYTGFDHPTGSTTYTFNDYGTYLVRVTANLLNIKNDDGTPIGITSDIVFTILNPNEARRALDFTSIYGYDIIKVESISNGVYKDVTEKFMTLLDDAPNASDVNVYNRLVTYERALEVFGSSIKGKMKFRVQYRVQDDELLPARYEEFSFTLNNQSATLSASIEPGGKTTKPVTIKFNPANIYELVGDCNILINGEKIDAKIDENAPNRVVEITVDAIGEYYIQLVGDSGNVITTFNFTIKEPMNTVSIILIVVVSVLVVGLIGTFIWLRTRMKVR